MTLTATTVMLSPVAAVLPSTAQAGALASTAARPSSAPAPVVPRADTSEVVTAVAAAGAERAAADADLREEADPQVVRATYRYLQQLVSRASLGSAAPAPSTARPVSIEPTELIGVIAYFESTHALPVEEGADVDARA